MFVTFMVFVVFKASHKILKVLNQEKEEREYVSKKGNPSYDESFGDKALSKAFKTVDAIDRAGGAIKSSLTDGLPPLSEIKNITDLGRKPRIMKMGLGSQHRRRQAGDGSYEADEDIQMEKSRLESLHGGDIEGNQNKIHMGGYTDRDEQAQ